MLFLLTGEIQTGKTRWLTRQIDLLEAAGTTVCGVIAPGQWIDRGGSYEKTGIDNVLLPERRTIAFARRRDLARGEGSFDEASQAARANLRWAIDDGAIEQVNDHFARLAAIDEPGRRLLVADEFGILELERDEGLSQAVALIDRGATDAFPHALVVVRTGLADRALARFADADWHGVKVIRPDDEHTLIDGQEAS